MKVLLDPRPRSREHCGAVHQLRIRKDLAAAATAHASASARAHSSRRNRISLYVGEVAASQLPVVLDTLLGSCVAVCLYDPALRAGGMNHILLPNCRAGERSPRCGIHAMELLINELMKLGGDRRRFVAKAFGGANVLQGMKMPPVGDGNARFVREFLALEKIPLVAERMGGTHAVHLYFHTDTGKATVHTVDGTSLPKIIDAEGSYGKSPSTGESFGGEITLF
jgi:chemotaxis receptor (MCP) glutamine deamidase CheD